MASGSTPHAEAGVRARGDARTRILDTAYELFCRHGTRAVGIDRIVAEADVAKMTLYHHFASKDDLILAFLELRDDRWTRNWFQAEVERRAATPADRALTVFDVFDAWFHRPDFESCPFLRTVLETGPDNPVHAEAVRFLDEIKSVMEQYAGEAGARDPAEAAHQLQILMMGTIMSATRGDLDAAQHVRPIAEHVLASAR
jgi:AcrR family transcriptional regulator